MPPYQDRYEVSLQLVTIAGTEYAMQADLSQCEDVAELEDDILCFLPTVSDSDVFGCNWDLLDLHTQQPLPEAFRTVLRKTARKATQSGTSYKVNLARLMHPWKGIAQTWLRC